MPYTKIGSFIAGAAFIVGCVQIALGFGVATGTLNEPYPGFFLGGSTSEQAVEAGVIKLLAAVAFGIITEISRSVEKK